MPQLKYPKTSTLALVIATIAAIAASMQASSAGYVFQAPSGWHKLTGTARGLGVWVHMDKEPFHQNVSLLAQRYSGTLDAFTNANIGTARSAFPDVQMGNLQHIRVCGTHPATYISYAGTVRGNLLVFEQVATIWQHIAYVSTYTRLSKQPMIDSARQSLTTMCAGQSAPAARPAYPVSQPIESPTPTPQTPAPGNTYGPPAPIVSP